MGLHPKMFLKRKTITGIAQKSAYKNRLERMFNLAVLGLLISLFTHNALGKLIR